MDRAEHPRQEAVAGHRHEHPRLAEKKDQQHARHAGQTARGNQRRRAAEGVAVRGARLFREGVGNGGLDVDVRVGDHAGDHGGDGDIKDRGRKSEARMPTGTSRCGRRASSACVEMESKPMKAKKTIAAPNMIPDRP